MITASRCWTRSAIPARTPYVARRRQAAREEARRRAEREAAEQEARRTVCADCGQMFTDDGRPTTDDRRPAVATAV
uniref:HNH endonuclease n=1 Tax=Streptomyces sp. NBC_00180 TaxID=2903632 RepID=A0AAU1I905_9ACTN